MATLVELSYKSGADNIPTGMDVSGKGRLYYETIYDRLLSSVTSSSELPHLIAVTSCNIGEGVSTVASNLAVTLAGHSNERVLLVDANFHHPSAHKIFGVNLFPGLIEILEDSQDSKTAIKPSTVENLFILSTGAKKSEISDEYESQVFADLLDILKQDYSFIVFDTPPMSEGNCAVRLAGLADGVILVVEAEQVRWQVAQRAKERLVHAKANMLGVVLNKRKFHVPAWLYRRL